MNEYKNINKLTTLPLNQFRQTKTMKKYRVPKKTIVDILSISIVCV